ncbi:hypothetical protein BDA96_06G202700 [Sorghum bicolor]|uniref:Uncharacterized protein n=1 Tax=Sorghum bicolor TaxID=4558 RepID=A0A921UDQ1_SORBI|nr:hypothetical protein BDA96_06G202700 [Sorghum bicolor]
MRSHSSALFCPLPKESCPVTGLSLWFTIVRTASSLHCSLVLTGLSPMVAQGKVMW